VAYLGERAARRVEVPVRSLDSVLGAATVSLIKLDVEGAECEALTGARGALDRARRCRVLLEHQPRNIEEEREAADWMTAHNYAMGLVEHDGNIKALAPEDLRLVDQGEMLVFER
jgi:hypothetical protein